MIAIAHTGSTINIAQAGTAMMTAKTTTQADIAIKIAKATAMQTKSSQGGQGGHSRDDRQKGDCNCAGNQGQSHHVEEKHSCSCS
eukprot:13290778-Ditylum_brightwellii.AAC.1